MVTESVPPLVNGVGRQRIQLCCVRDPLDTRLVPNSDSGQFLIRVISCDFVDRLIRSWKRDPRASHEITPTKFPDKLEFEHRLSPKVVLTP